MSVVAAIEPLTLPTYVIGAPEKNPVFFEKRVYQGSSGKVYPVPFIDRVTDGTAMVTYRSVRLENEFVRLVMLPEIGGRILIGQDKTNNDYDFFYRQEVIKPALVGLAGPWISGGVEFNWPQHHRPGTFLPTDFVIEEESDGARTVWMSEHDPLNRLKGMHGLRLRPGSSLIELRVLLFNRTPLTQTFLWWANVAARVHDQYQSFFPPDVHYVADHAVRAQSSFPVARQPYYGVPYQDREGANDLTWYKNIPVPTSYMICETAYNFFGGYDHAKRGGFVHVADRNIAPGKKQWTWGNHPFGCAWDRQLTDEGGPYIELMAGVYTDNQPDFSYLAPYETRKFSQFWWPIQHSGPVQQASERAALRLVVAETGAIDVAVLVSAPVLGASIVLTEGERVLLHQQCDLYPGRPLLYRTARLTGDSAQGLLLSLKDADGGEILSYRPAGTLSQERSRPLAVEPPSPPNVNGPDELLLIGEHLEQYRHPTRDPETYWREALRRDPGDARSNLFMGRRLLRRGLFTAAATHLEHAIRRLTAWHPNPVTGEAHYYLGLVRRWQECEAESAALFSKAAWNHESRAAASYELAALAARRRAWKETLNHLEVALDGNRQNQKALVLRAATLRRMGRSNDAAAALAAALEADPLNHWALCEHGVLTGDESAFLTQSRNDAQTVLDVAFDYGDAGMFREAIHLIELHHANPVIPVAVPNPMQRTTSSHYVLAWLKHIAGVALGEVASTLARARQQPPDYFFPSRTHEQVVLEWAINQPGPDPVASFALGNYLYDLKRHEEAIAAWEQAISSGAKFATVHRNLGIAYWNVRRDAKMSRAAYERALKVDADDARLVYEFDQLQKKLNVPLGERLEFMEEHRALVDTRDDASVELAALYNMLQEPEEAMRLLQSRRFHPWEGGEGAVLGQYTAACLLMGQKRLKAGDAVGAICEMKRAFHPPASLGEVPHLLQARADVNYWLGMAYQAAGCPSDAEVHFRLSAEEQIDFSEMAVTAHSSLSYYRGLSLRQLGRNADAQTLFDSLKRFARERLGRPATIDYFATSLPNLLVFEEDLQRRRDAEQHLLLALAHHGLGELDEAARHLSETQAFTNSNFHAIWLAAVLASSVPAEIRECGLGGGAPSG